MKQMSAETQRELVKALQREYRRNGPRGDKGAVFPFARFAQLSRQQVDIGWDFSGRHRMHQVAKLLAKARAEMGE